MAVSTTIPASWKLPLFWAVVDGSQAGNLTEEQPALLAGQAFLAGAATAALKNGSTGNGTIAMDAVEPVLGTASVGIYKVVFTSPTAFTVSTPAPVSLGAGVVGTEFSNQVQFTITAGGAAFAAADEFDITVTKVPVGKAVYNVPVPVGSVADAQYQFGIGSMVERMVNTFFQGNTTQQMWVLPVPDPAAGVAATGSIVLSNALTGSGVLYAYFSGQLVSVVVASTDTAPTIATNLVATINALTTLPVTAAVDGTNTSKVNLTCRWKGLTGNDIQIGFNYLGLYGGQSFPSGVTVVVNPMANGAGEPDFTAAISAIASKQFYHVAMPYSDTASLEVWDAEMGFGPTGRWAFTRQQYGWVYNYFRSDYADALEWGEAHNSSVISTMVLEPTAPTPVWEFTAGYCAQGAAALLDDPARPLQTLEIPGCLPAPVAQRFSQTELNDLTNSGLAIQGVAPSGNPMILREALQYQVNSYGQADTAFALMTVLSNLAELLSRMKAAITSKYPPREAGAGWDAARARPSGRHPVDPEGRARRRGPPGRIRWAHGQRGGVHRQPHRRDRRQQPEPRQCPLGSPAHGPAAPVRRLGPVPPRLPDDQPDLTDPTHPSRREAPRGAFVVSDSRRVSWGNALAAS